MRARLETKGRGDGFASWAGWDGRSVWLTALALAVYWPTSSASAAGIAVLETSVKGLGVAFAGRGAACEDASTVFSNPAGMTCLQGSRLEFGAHAIFPSAKFSDEGTSFATGDPVGGGEGGELGEPVVVPSVYYVRPVTEGLRFGVGITSPYGLETRYRRSWVGRYHAIKSRLRTVDVNPAVAYRVDEFLSVGGGLSLQYADAEVTNALDLGGIGSGLAAPGSDDGHVRVKGDDVAYGFNFGLLIEPFPSTRVGLHYRSKIVQTLEGNARFTNSGSALAKRTSEALRLVDQGARAKVSLPETLSLSVFQHLGARWALLADATWTRWSRLQELRIKFDKGARDTVTTLDWNDTWRLALGTTYTADARWTWRAGLAYDESPVPNARLRTPGIPDASRTWLAVGVSYRHSEQLDFALGYAHLFLDNPRINRAAVGEDTFRGALRGRYDSAIDIFGLELTWRLP